MPQPWDDARGPGPGYTQAAGFGPNGQDPRMRPQATPPQFQREAPPRQDGTRAQQPQYEPRQDPQPAFTHGPWQGAQPPRGQYQQPQPYPPQYAPGPPRRPSWPSRHKGLTVFLSLCGLVFIIGIAAAAASPSSSKGNPPAAAQTQAAAPAAAKAPVAAVKTVATFSGSGVQSTPPFTVTSTWRLDYKFDCSSFGYAGNFIVMEDGSLGGAMDVNTLAMSKSGTSYAYNDAGQHYVKVDSECAWTLKVIDEG